MNESSEKIQVERKEIQRAAKDLRDAHPSEILAWG